MFYSIDELDLTLLRRKSEMTILKSMAIRNGDKSMLFQAQVMENEIKSQEGKKGEMNLNQFINYIELTFDKPGSIDPFKITASRAFSLYHKAKAQNERIKQMYK